MKEEIKVSVIIPTYNSEECLPTLLDNLLNGQTLKNIEVILIDDGSTDNTKKKITKFEKDKRFSYHYQKNKGAGAARNRGLKLAKADYVICLDADDLYDRQMLEEMYNCAVEFDAEIVNCLFGFDNYKEQISLKGVGFKNLPELKCFSYQEYPNSLYEIRVNPNSKLYKNKFVKDSNLKYSETYCDNDTMFFIKAIRLASKVVCLPKTLFKARRYYLESSISSNRLKHMVDPINNYIDEEKWLKEHFVDKEDILALAHIEWGSILYNTSIGYNSEFLDKLNNLFDMFPWNALDDEGRRQLSFDREYYQNKIMDQYRNTYYSDKNKISNDLGELNSSLYRLLNSLILEDFLYAKYPSAYNGETLKNTNRKNRIGKRLMPASKQNLDDQIGRLEEEIFNLKKDNELIIRLLNELRNKNS